VFAFSFQLTLSVAQKSAVWRMPESTAVRLESEYYATLRGPLELAPRGLRPLTLGSGLISYDWLCFSRLYGKYLLSHFYDDAKMEVLGPLLDLVKLCVSSSLPKDFTQRSQHMVRTVATRWEELFPEGEMSIMMHLLMFHIPDQLQYWGPAYGHWCFPFERSDSRTELAPHCAKLARHCAKLARHSAKCHQH
jgi:hypothetical protein